MKYFFNTVNPGAQYQPEKKTVKYRNFQYYQSSKLDTLKLMMS
jgi:hypothetical protein